jgi:hypothetical protein
MFNNRIKIQYEELDPNLKGLVSLLSWITNGYER